MRNEVIYIVTDEGRDKGKVFKLTEMDAAKAEDLALRALFLLEKSGGLPDDILAQIKGTGAFGVAAAGFKVFCQNCPYEDVKPILDEMWKCIQFIPNPNNHNIFHPVLPNEIEEVMTRVALRMEVFQLHLGFSQRGEALTSISNSTKEASPPQTSRATSTSPARSAQSSALEKRRSQSSKPSTG